MSQEKIILELMGRIQVLEEDVSNLKKKYQCVEVKEEVGSYNLNSTGKRVKIRKKEVEALYKYSKLVFEEVMGRDEAIDIIHEEFCLNKNSIGDYIYGFRCLLTGEKYVRTMNTMAMKYFYQQILNDYGEERLKIALGATMEHIIYYEAVAKTTMKTMREIHSEFSKLIQKDD